MLVKGTQELENGAVEFTAELNEEETSFLIEWAINNLLAQGIQPFLQEDNFVDLEDLEPASEAIN